MNRSYFKLFIYRLIVVIGFQTNIFKDESQLIENSTILAMSCDWLSN